MVTDGYAECARLMSRRSFLKEAGLIASSFTVSTFFSSACNQETATSSTPSPSPSSTPISSSAPASSIISSGTPTSGFKYVASREGVELKLVPGCTSWVAMDRMYTAEHIWAKSIESGMVVLGMTDKLQLLMSRITALQLRRPGEPITRAETFGYAEGDKMSVELMAPFSGQVIDINNNIWAGGGDNDGLDLITSDPYFNGWLAVVQPSKPAELAELITPEAYMALNAKTVA